MVEKARGDDIARLYLMISASAAGYSPSAIQAALAMSITLLGEQQGLTGLDLLLWIDLIAATARLAARTDVTDRRSQDHSLVH